MVTECPHAPEVAQLRSDVVVDLVLGTGDDRAEMIRSPACVAVVSGGGPCSVRDGIDQVSRVCVTSVVPPWRSAHAVSSTSSAAPQSSTPAPSCAITRFTRCVLDWISTSTEAACA